MKFIAIAAVTASLVAGSVVTPQISFADSAHARASASSVRSTVQYTDEDVLALFAGQGQILAAHADLSQFVSTDHVPLTTEELSAVLGEYRSAEPDFHDKVTVPLQSGDPYRALDALNAFRAASERAADDSAVANAGDGKCVVVLAAGVLLWVAVATKVWLYPKKSGSDNSLEFSAALAEAFRSR